MAWNIGQVPSKSSELLSTTNAISNTRSGNEVEPNYFAQTWVRKQKTACARA